MAKLYGAIVATVLALLAPVVAAVPAQAAADVTSTATIRNTPDDGNPPWARSTFTRTTTIADNGDGTFKVSIKDSGEFKTARKADGAKTPGDPAQTVKRRVTGTITGSGEFTVTGKLKGHNGLNAQDGRVFGYGKYATKSTVPANLRTGAWALHFFKQGATSTGIDPWHWEYKTACEQMVQDSAAGVSGNITGKKCDEPPAEPEFTPSKITAAAKCRIGGTSKQTWTLTRAPGSEQHRKVTAIGWVYYPNSKYDKANSYGPTDDPNDGWTYLGDLSVPADSPAHTVTTPYGGGLSVHFWDGHANKSKLWATSSAKVTCG